MVTDEAHDSVAKFEVLDTETLDATDESFIDSELPSLSGPKTDSEELNLAKPDAVNVPKVTRSPPTDKPPLNAARDPEDRAPATLRDPLADTDSLL